MQNLSDIADDLAAMLLGAASKETDECDWDDDLEEELKSCFEWEKTATAEETEMHVATEKEGEAGEAGEEQQNGDGPRAQGTNQPVQLDPVAEEEEQDQVEEDSHVQGGEQLDGVEETPAIGLENGQTQREDVLDDGQEGSAVQGCQTQEGEVLDLVEEELSEQEVQAQEVGGQDPVEEEPVEQEVQAQGVEVLDLLEKELSELEVQTQGVEILDPVEEEPATLEIQAQKVSGQDHVEEEPTESEVQAQEVSGQDHVEEAPVEQEIQAQEVGGQDPVEEEPVEQEIQAQEVGGQDPVEEEPVEQEIQAQEVGGQDPVEEELSESEVQAQEVEVLDPVEEEPAALEVQAQEVEVQDPVKEEPEVQAEIPDTTKQESAEPLEVQTEGMQHPHQTADINNINQSNLVVREEQAECPETEAEVPEPSETEPKPPGETDEAETKGPEPTAEEPPNAEKGEMLEDRCTTTCGAADHEPDTAATVGGHDNTGSWAEQAAASDMGTNSDEAAGTKAEETQPTETASSHASTLYNDMALQVLQQKAPRSMVSKMMMGLNVLIQSDSVQEKQRHDAREGLEYLTSQSICSMLDMYMVQSKVNGGIVMIRSGVDEAVMMISEDS